MTVEQFDTMDAIEKHLVKAVYKTVPSKSNKEIGKWKKHDGEDLAKATGLKDRLFDVIQSDDEPELLFTFNKTDTYAGIIDIEIAYPMGKEYKKIARGDFTKIKGQVMNSTNIALFPLGFSFFRFGDPLLETSDEDEYQIYTIPLICQYTVTQDSSLEYWQNTPTGTAVQSV
jgi:hypothetical protein